MGEQGKGRGEQGKGRREQDKAKQNTVGTTNCSIGLQNPREETQLRAKLHILKTKLKSKNWLYSRVAEDELRLEHSWTNSLVLT